MKPPSNRQIRLFVLFAGCFIMVLVLVFFYVWEYTTMTELRYRQDKLNKELNRLEVRNRELRMKVMSAESLARVEKEASRLGLCPPDRGQMVVLEEPPMVNTGSQP